MKILVIANDAIFDEDGYKVRIEMEYPLLAETAKIVLAYPKLNDKCLHFIGDSTVPYPTLPQAFPFFLNKIIFPKWLKNQIAKDGPPDAVYAENLISAILAGKIANQLNIPFIYDCHGTTPDEILMYHGKLFGTIYSAYLRLQEKKAVRKADLVVAVTQAQLNLIKVKEDKGCIFPMIPKNLFFQNITQEIKKKIREELDIGTEKTIFVYSGQMQAWQMVEETVQVFQKIEQQNTNAHLLILTRQKEEFENILRNYQIKNYTVTSAPHEKMNQYLSICDFGFALRKNHIINKVASPTKILEYMACGVMPILTNHVGDFSKIISEKNLCIKLNDNLSIDQINWNCFKDKKQILKEYASTFSKEKIEQYHTAIMRICGGK